MFKCKLHYFVYVEKGMLQIYGVLELEFFFFKRVNYKKRKEKQKAKYKSLILLIMISQQNNKSLSSIVS